MKADAGTGNVSLRVATFVADARLDDLPANVRHEAKRSLLNFFGCALAGSHDADIAHLFKVTTALSGPAAATVIGRAQRVDLLTAAFLNAASANVFDFDDTHIPTIIHPTAPVAPALLALAETRRVSGAELLLAFVLGVDVTCRLGNALHPAHYRRGWHITSTCGVFGAAVAAAKLIGIDAGRIVWALGGAAAQASGLVETLGSTAKSIGVGNSARNGLFAALAADAGATGPLLPIEGQRGFAAVTGEQPNLAELITGLGERWEILNNTYKPYPCGVVLNSVIDGCLALREGHALAADRIARVVVSGHPLLGERTDRAGIKSGREAQVSAQHAAAVALLRGAADLAQFSDAAVRDPAVSALRGRVTVERDAAIPVEAADVRIELMDGQEFQIRIPHGRGSLQRPLSDREIEDKVRALARHGGFKADVSPLIDAIWSIERADDVAAIVRLTAAAE
jgi:2-methylcitrate dehydratase PrpD